MVSEIKERKAICYDFSNIAFYASFVGIRPVAYFAFYLDQAAFFDVIFRKAGRLPKGNNIMPGGAFGDLIAILQRIARLIGSKRYARHRRLFVEVTDFGIFTYVPYEDYLVKRHGCSRKTFVLANVTKFVIADGQRFQRKKKVICFAVAFASP